MPTPGRRLLLARRAALSLLLAASTVGAAGAATAQAAAPNCSVKHNENGEGAAWLNKGVNLKTGPYSGCGNVTWAAKDTYVYFLCWYDNSYGNTWWYVRIKGTSTHGWTSQDNFYGDMHDENGDGFITPLRCKQ
ncbi:hypothetical protein [Planomonospora venezuelensis]|uniref:SH3 domain-containing protein n=1 Tax=Planomonospora venezuelensis TaxID=1999 RepID=A0A841DEF1_PLAVE|nr:hypothetical protein [Planomonospora venezuelensis]MBB5967849.1 hypothetical protein [Planomonospora venezuelensis]GIN03249.1 hypothetical protein Pve01_49070 [Planomonospora venezuelensis]